MKSFNTIAILTFYFLLTFYSACNSKFQKLKSNDKLAKRKNMYIKKKKELIKEKERNLLLK